MAEAVEGARVSGDPEQEADVLRRFGFAIPTPDALATIAALSPSGVIEIGAGTGYWAQALHRAGVDVIAYDVEPPPSENNPWFAGTTPWYPVLRGDERMARRHPERSLLLVWPTRNDTWAAEAVAYHHEAGGQSVFYVGQPPGGRTGDPALHARLSGPGRCVACAYGIPAADCTCAVPALWTCTGDEPLPPWQGNEVSLYVYERLDPERSGPRRKYGRRWPKR